MFLFRGGKDKFDKTEWLFRNEAAKKESSCLERGRPSPAHSAAGCSKCAGLHCNEKAAREV
jgi:hypothetical protein